MFIFFLSNEGMLLATAIVAKSAQNYPKLPNFVKICPETRNFEIPPKTKILIFFKIKNPTYRRRTKACAYRLDFQYNNFYMPFVLSKNGLCMYISAFLLVENNFFLYVPHLLWVWDFVDLYLTHLETRIKCCTIHAYLKKLFFWPSKLCYPPLAHGEKKLFCQL
jgi:hypothetical protein